MNVRGFLDDDKESILQVSTQNDSLVAISRRFQAAIASSPSEESDRALLAIITEISPPQSDYERTILFQCNRELSKSLISRSLYTQAIPYLLASLKTDEMRADLWSQLALCASKTSNSALYLAATTRLTSIRPNLSVPPPPPLPPHLTPTSLSPYFVGYSLTAPCFRQFLTALTLALPNSPHYIPEFFIQTPVKSPQFKSTQKVLRPPHLKHNPVVASMPPLMALSSYPLAHLFSLLPMPEIAPSTFLSSIPVSHLSTLTLSLISSLPHRDQIPRDVISLLLQIAGHIPLSSLPQPTLLFLAELSSVMSPPPLLQSLLRHLMLSTLHSPTTLLRISFASLSQPSLSPPERDSLISSCEAHFTRPIAVTHAGYVIDLSILSRKRHQNKLLTKLSSPYASFSESDFKDLLYLKTPLSSLVRVALQVHSDLLPHLPSLIKDSPSSSHTSLEKYFSSLNTPLTGERAQKMAQVVDALMKVNAAPDLLCLAAITYARLTVPSRERTLALVKIHRQIGKRNACWRLGGKFLEYLVDSLGEEDQNELTGAFGCMFADISVGGVNHHSELKLRCSKYLQRFVDHLNSLDASISGLFNAYMEIWLHMRGGCNCINNVDGWRMYKIVKKKETQLLKFKLPEGVTPRSVLEDMAKKDGECREESRIALVKGVMRGFYAGEVTSLSESMDMLKEMISSPLAALLWCICLALESDKEHEVNIEDELTENSLLINPEDSILSKRRALTILRDIGEFENKKREARRVYWILRLAREIGDNARDIAEYAVGLAPSLLPEYAAPVVYEASKALNTVDPILQVTRGQPKGKPLHVLYIIEIAKSVSPEESFKMISGITRSKSTNINSFFHFDYKPLFLLSRPSDLDEIRGEALKIFVDSAAASGHYLDLFCLFSPSGKLDRKLSRVMIQNRVIFGVDRVEIFIRYVQELHKAVENGDGIPESIRERVIDALAKGFTGELGERASEVMERFLRLVWVKATGSEMPEDGTVNDLIGILDETEEEEEEDGEFNKESGSDDEDVDVDEEDEAEEDEYD